MGKEFDINNNNAFSYINKKKKESEEKIIEPAYQEQVKPVVAPVSQFQESSSIKDMPQVLQVQEESHESKNDSIAEKEEKEPTRQFSVYIPVSLFNKFRVYSEIKGISQKKILVDALKEYMDKINDDYIKEELLKKRPF